MSKHSQDDKPMVLWLIPSAMLFLALFPLPYGYYILLRLVICVVSGYICFDEYNIRQSVSMWVIVFGFFSLLYNPLVPFHLGRLIWAPVNVITAIFLIFHLISYRKRSG